MAQNNDVTGTYGSAAAARTSTYQSESEKTYSYADLQETEFKSKAHGIGVGDNISLHGQDYAVTGIISEGTGEAVIYKIADKNLNVLALKLYFEFSNPKEEPNGETLRRIKEIIDPDILRLHDFGVGSDKYRGKYCFEISDFAEGGDLFSVHDLKAHYTPEHIEKTIIPEVFSGIKKLHSYRIYHCDLKPWNILYLDRARTNIVIGDYGSGKIFDLETEKESRKTSTLKGTEAYLSPEQSRGIISEKNDYYSFGVILLQLLYPESIAVDSDFRRTDKEKFERVVERQYNAMPIIEYDSRYGRLNRLIEGLTLLNHHNRWGSAEVEKWLKGEDVEVKYRGDGFESVQPVKLGYATIKSGKDFIRVLEAKTDAYHDLIEDPDTYTTVKSWLDSYRDIPTRKSFDNMVRFYQPLGKEFVNEAMLRFFEPNRAIVIDMHSFNFFTSADIRKEVERFIGKLDEIWKITSLEQLRFYLFQLEFSLRQVQSYNDAQDSGVVGALIDKLYSMLGLVQKPFENFATEIQTNIDPKKEKQTHRQLLKLFYAFQPSRTFKDSNNNSIPSLDELALFFVRNKTAFSDKFIEREKERFLEKLNKTTLTKLNYIPFVFEVFKDKAEAHLEFLELSFDKKRNYKVSYQHYKSLNKFLSQRGLTTEFTSCSGNAELYRGQRKYMGTFDSACEDFIAAVCKTHNITTLTKENLTEIREKFRRESWKRYLFIIFGDLLMPFRRIPPGSLEKLREQEAATEKHLQWKPALLAAGAGLIGTLLLLFYFGVSMGWIPLNRDTYLTFAKSANLDGEEYSEGDYLKVTNQEEFATCLKNDLTDQCYPTKAAAAIFNSRGSSSIDRIGIDKLGAADYELKQPKTVFKVTKPANLIVHQFPTGSIVDVTLDDGRQLCFQYGKKGHCFPKRSQCRGKCPDMIDDYGYVINNYRGRRLFTFTQAATADYLTYPRGSSWEVSRESRWATCIATPGSSTTRCFLTEPAIRRFGQSNVPVVADFGAIGPRKMTVTQLGFGFSAFVVLLVAGIVFWAIARVAKQVRLFFLRGEINSLKFRLLAESEAFVEKA